MLAFTDPEDVSLMLSDMTQQRNDLKREHHIRAIKKLAQRHYGLRVMTIQKCVIKELKKQRENIQVEIKNVYSNQNAIKDYESKGYMIYLLDMLDFYGKNVDKLKEQVKELDNNTKGTYLKLCAKKQEYAKKIRKTVWKIPKVTVVDIFERRIERSTHEMGRLITKIHNFRDNIRHMFIVRGNYFNIYQELVEQNKRDKEIISDQLQNAVTAYRSREDFLYKTGVLRDRLMTDMQKVTANNILLHRIKERDVQAEEFEHYKTQERTDCRASQIEESVRKGVTGLEPEIDTAKAMHERIMAASGATSVEDIQERFPRLDNHNFNLFCYISTLNEEIDELDSQLKVLRQEIVDLEQNLTVDQRKCRRDLAAGQSRLDAISEEASQAESRRNVVQKDLQTASQLILRLVESLPGKEESQTTSDEEVESEVLEDSLTFVETKMAEILMLIEYLEYLEVDHKEPEKQTEAEEEFDEDLESGTHSLPSASLVDRAPRRLSDSRKETMQKLMEAPAFLKLDDLKETALSVVEEPSSLEGSTPSLPGASSAT